MKSVLCIPKISVSYQPFIRDELPTITCSSSAYEVFKTCFDKETISLYEEFYVMYVNRGGKVIGVRLLNRGTASNTNVNLRLLFAIAVTSNAASVILAHNHPSGNQYPSNLDIQLTKKIIEQGELMDIKVLDHLIITVDGYYSLSDERKM